MAFYLHIKAVNISNFVYDTQDLSTIRGGGLLLLRAIDKITERFKELKPISTGASAGLFRCETDLKDRIVTFLKDCPRFKHATFMVNSVLISGNFDLDRETLTALTRWQQLQSPTVIYPELQPPTERAVCEIDFVRPASREVKKGEKPHCVSESVYQRRKYGQEEKQALYRQEIEKLDKSLINSKKFPNFVMDFEELTQYPERGNLSGKMAVIYLDGNDFGKKQRHLCKEGGEKSLEEFDKKVKEYRRSFLAHLLNDTVNSTGWTNSGNHRLEILLWGGDEMILVVPAWQGWWTLNYFFQSSKNWTVFDPDPKNKEIQLTHAAGLVFCHHNAPIYRITALAKQLAELAKNKGLKDKGRKDNYVAYQVLESFDYPGDDLETFRQSRCPNGIEPNNLIIDGNQMNTVLSPIHAVKRDLPKGLIYKIVQALLYKPKEVKELIDRAEKDYLTLPQSSRAEYEKLQQCFGTSEIFWIHLIELWDYLEFENTVEYEKSQSKIP